MGEEAKPMRKFNSRWWVTPRLIQWRYMVECGDYSGAFAWFPHQPACIFLKCSTGRSIHARS